MMRKCTKVRQNTRNYLRGGRLGRGIGDGGLRAEESSESNSLAETGWRSFSVREKARSTMPSNIGISESPVVGRCKSPRLCSQRCDMRRLVADSRDAALNTA